MIGRLKVYDVELTTCGPLFIGSGSNISKKEYINVGRNKVVIPKLDKMYADLRAMGKHRAYEEFMLSSGRESLKQWLDKMSIQPSYIEKWKKYELDSGDCVGERGKQLQVLEFVKDAYGMPYVPGSSLKGMLRTVLLAYDIRQNPKKYDVVKRNIKNSVLMGNGKKIDRKYLLVREAGELDRKAFRTLSRNKAKTDDIVNDFMAGFIVGDSEPIAVDRLVLCQKIECHTDGECRRLNILRECLKPETTIRFQISIDSELCDLDESDIMNAIKDFGEVYYDEFSGKFPNVDRPDKNTVWLGGGTGYVSKTVVYSMFGGEALRVVPAIFDKSGVPASHKHNRDMRQGVSPHILKLTSYKGKTYQFGECKFSMSMV